MTSHPSNPPTPTPPPPCSSPYPCLKHNLSPPNPRLKIIKHPSTMSRRNGKGPKLDLKLNLSPPPRRVESPGRTPTASPTSPPSSCVSSENQEEAVRCSTSPEATSMVLVGCPRCLMYVMLSEDDPKCPKCKSTVLLDFLHESNSNTTGRKTRKN